MFRQDRTNPSTKVSQWRGRSSTPKAWPSTRISTWQNGGLFGAAGGVGWEAIATVTEAGAAATISFTSIPTTYVDLKIVYIGTSSADAYNVFVFNTDTGGTYQNMVLQGYLNGVDGAGGTMWISSVGSEWFPLQTWPKATGTNVFACGEIHLPGYYRADVFKPGFFQGSNRDTTSYTGAQAEGGPLNGWYLGEQTAALTQIDMGRSSGTWDNFTCTLFGLGASA